MAQGGYGHRPCPLHCHAGGAVQPRDRFSQLLFGHEQQVVGAGAPNVQRLIVDLSRQPVGQRRGDGGVHHPSGAHAARHGGGLLTLHANHAHVRRKLTQHAPHAAQQTTTAGADQHRLHGRQLRQQLEGHRALPGEQVEPQARVDEADSFACGVRPGHHHGHVVIGRLVVYRGTQRPDPVLLHLRRVGRHVQHGRRTEGVRRIRHAQPVVAGARGHHAPRAFLRRQAGQHVVRAAHLERAGGILQLELEPDVHAQRL